MPTEMSDNVHAVPIVETPKEIQTNPHVDVEEVSETTVPSPEGVDGLFSAKVFGVKNDFFAKINPEGMEQLKVIEDFILGKMGDNDIKISEESFTAMIEEMISMVGIDKSASSSIRIKELFTAIKLANFLK